MRMALVCHHTQQGCIKVSYKPVTYTVATLLNTLNKTKLMRNG